MGVYWLFYRPQSAATERLKRLGESNGSSTVAPVSIVEEHSGEKFAERLASPLNRLVPPSAAEAKKLQKQLMQAGFRSRKRADHLSRDSAASAGWFSGDGCAGLRAAGAASKQCSPLDPVGFCHRLLPAALCSESNDSIAATSGRWGLADALDLMVISIEADLV